MELYYIAYCLEMQQLLFGINMYLHISFNIQTTVLN